MSEEVELQPKTEEVESKSPHASSVLISLNDSPLGAIQSFKEDFEMEGDKLIVTLRISRIIFDNFSLLNHILNGKPTVIKVSVGDQHVAYEGFRLAAASRNFHADDYLYVENLTLTTKPVDVELEKLKMRVKMLREAKQDLAAGR